MLHIGGVAYSIGEGVDSQGAGEGRLARVDCGQECVPVLGDRAAVVGVSFLVPAASSNHEVDAALTNLRLITGLESDRLLVGEKIGASLGDVSLEGDRNCKVTGWVCRLNAEGV